MKFFCNHYYTHRLVSATFQRVAILRVPNLGKILKNDNSEFFFSIFGNISKVTILIFPIVATFQRILILSFSNRGNISQNGNSDFSNRGNISNNYNSEFFQSWQHLISCLRAQPSSCPVVAPLISGAFSFTASFTFHSVSVDSILN